MGFYSAPNLFAAQKLTNGEPGKIVAQNDALAPRVVRDRGYMFHPVSIATKYIPGDIIFCNKNGFGIYSVVCRKGHRVFIETNTKDMGSVDIHDIYGKMLVCPRG